MRGAAGFAVPLIVGILIGRVALALPAAVGALLTAFADRPGPLPLRVARLAATALAGGFYTTLSVAVSRNTAASVALLTCAGLLAGLLVAAGESAALLGTLAVACGLVIAHTALPPSAALPVGLLLTAGGLAQAALALLALPLRRHRVERAELAELYHALAAAAASTDVTDRPPASRELNDARDCLYGFGHDVGAAVERYRALLETADQIRSNFVTLRSLRRRLADQGAARSVAEIEAALAAASAALGATGERIRRGIGPDGILQPAVQSACARVAAAACELVTPASALGELTRTAAARRVSDLGKGLQAAFSLATGGTTGESPVASLPRSPRRIEDPSAVLRAVLRIDTAVLNHAGRLALAVGATDLAGRLIPINRGYWIPLTVLMALRPDFGATFQRTILRVAGSLAGLAAASAAVHSAEGDVWWQIALAAGFLALARLYGGNPTPAAVGVSGLVVLLLGLDGYPPHAVIAARAVTTLIGGAVALGMVLAWPAWERRHLPARLADLLSSYGSYAAAIADCPRAGRAHARRETLLARGHAEASLARARNEPVVSRSAVELAQSLLADSHSVALALLTIDELRESLHSAAAIDRLDAILRATARELSTDATRLVSDRPVTLDPHRSIRVVRFALVTCHLEPDVAGALIDAVDRLTASVASLSADLGCPPRGY